MELIELDDAVRLCREREGKLFIKPALYSALGNGIKCFDPSCCTDERIKELFTETGSNFRGRSNERKNRAYTGR